MESILAGLVKGTLHVSNLLAWVEEKSAAAGNTHNPSACRQPLSPSDLRAAVLGFVQEEADCILAYNEQGPDSAQPGPSTDVKATASADVRPTAADVRTRQRVTPSQLSAINDADFPALVPLQPSTLVGSVPTLHSCISAQIEQRQLDTASSTDVWLLALHRSPNKPPR